MHGVLISSRVIPQAINSSRVVVAVVTVDVVVVVVVVVDSIDTDDVWIIMTVIVTMI